MTNFYYNLRETLKCLTNCNCFTVSSFLFFFAGEVERLLKEYRQNQELVRKIGSHYYQIIYPVQLRHHEKMGISTREVGAPKVRNRYRKRYILNSTVCLSHHSLPFSFVFDYFLVSKLLIWICWS